MLITVTTRVNDEPAEAIDQIAREEGMDRSTVIRRFLSASVRSWLMERSLEDYEKGRLTLWQAARKCGVSLWEIIDEVKRRAFQVPYSLEDLKEDLKDLKIG
jgi:predicted HTH domain antitoxin